MEAQIPYYKELKNCGLLAELTDEELFALTQGSKLREYDEQNSVICEEGKVGDGFFIILQGQVRVAKKDAKGKEHLLSVLKDGDFFGEMALLDMELRSASCYALEAVQVLWMSRKQFEEFHMQGGPMVSKLLFRMMMDMSKRLRLLSERYVYVKSCYTGGRV
jgi:CRP-like cAMP-binding protein